MKNSILIIFVFVIAVNLYSQGGSSYSLIGIGDLNHAGNAAYEGLGGTSIAFPSASSINFRNPALWSYVALTRLQAGYKFNQHFNERESLSNFQNNGSISNLSALFAIDTSNGIAASFGIMPFTNINYLSATPIKMQYEDIVLDGTTTYQGKGGLSIGYLGLSTKILSNLSVGVSAYTHFGKVTTSRVTEFINDNYLFKYTNYKEDYFSGFGLKGGIFYQPFENFSIGYYYEKNQTLDVESNYIYSSPLAGDTTVTTNSSYIIPQSQGFGLSYLTGVFLIGADFGMQDFKDFKYNPGNNSNFTDSWQFSLGVNRLGNESVTADNLDKVSYKFGLTVKKLYYNFSGSDIFEYSFSTGALIPWSESFATDIGLTFGTRGTSDKGLVKEYFGRLSVDFSIGELWFVPFKREY